MGQMAMQMYCRSCGVDTSHTKPTTSHVLHLLLTLLTMGIWLIVWILMGLNSATTAPRCAACKTYYNPTRAAKQRKAQAELRAQTELAAMSVRAAQTKVCPFCSEEVRLEAIKCKHCQSMLDGREAAR